MTDDDTMTPIIPIDSMQYLHPINGFIKSRDEDSITPKINP